MKPEHEELCARLDGYNPPDRTFDDQRQASTDIHDAAAAIRELSAEVERIVKENDTLRGLLGNSAKPCPYCGLAAEDQSKCASGFPGCARADDQMLSKHFADTYRADQAEAELAKVKVENSKLRSALEIVHFKREPWQ